MNVQEEIKKRIDRLEKYLETPDDAEEIELLNHILSLIEQARKEAEDEMKKEMGGWVEECKITIIRILNQKFGVKK